MKELFLTSNRNGQTFTYIWWIDGVLNAERRYVTAKDRSEIPERRELVNWNDTKYVFRTPPVGSICDKLKYGSYPDKLNDKTPLILTEEQYNFFFVMLVVWKHLTNVNVKWKYVNQIASVFQNKINSELAVLLQVILSAKNNSQRLLYI